VQGCERYGILKSVWGVDDQLASFDRILRRYAGRSHLDWRLETMNKPICHTVLHVGAAALILVQMLAISELRERGAEMRAEIHEAYLVVRQAAYLCGSAQ
jgi:hypothetical protein